ncbi:hypothetical protein BSKO_01478 [Bryopsis sp. KO-2023]|nr:hypothetical protein BSKO_01478 [Bryopsis sp. KO-2023]
MSTSQSKNQQDLSAWEKIRLGDLATWKEDELKTAIHWFRQAVSLVLGIVWGLIPFTGLNAFLTQLALNSIGTVVFYSSVIGVDPDEYGGHAVLWQEALGPAISMFMLAWVVTYSLVQF